MTQIDAIKKLLRNQPLFANEDGLHESIGGRTIMVTGAGGSIGSELCRQIVPYKPGCLVLLGHGEHSIFTIASELSTRFPDGRFVSVIANIQDRKRLTNVFAELRPDTVFHAAAHKHVPLMEENIGEAIINNVLGTENTVRAAIESDTETFVFISTDKAVNPVSIMGATKRVAEIIVGEAAKKTRRRFVSVRFGNVIGSRGSVVNTFQEQIARGGPLTVTHPEMERYFMTTHDAVHLVLQASKLGKGGEVFVFDMGQPLKIVDIARAMIESHGSKNGQFEIVFTGRRPGERLAEELFREGHYETTEHPRVLVLRNAGYAACTLRANLKSLIQAARRDDRAGMRSLLTEIAPESCVMENADSRETARGGATF
jgi:FlaA1/EpsC-like NDP-sugar epimerase